MFVTDQYVQKEYYLTIVFNSMPLWFLKHTRLCLREEIFRLNLLYRTISLSFLFPPWNSLISKLGNLKQDPRYLCDFRFLEIAHTFETMRRLDYRLLYKDQGPRTKSVQGCCIRVQRRLNSPATTANKTAINKDEVRRSVRRILSIKLGTSK